MTFKEFIKKYSHGWTALYILIYLPWFSWLEKKVTTDFYVIHVPLDDKIPFCEYFIIPYLLWFLFVAATIVYLFFYSKKEYYQACAFLFTGMTLFLILCTIWPNGLNLRQDVYANNNIFTQLVKTLRETDTSTNVFPSIHVFNSIGCFIALFKSKGLKGHKLIKAFVAILTVSIILSTMFLKQHSVVDVIGGIVLGAVLYPLIYMRKAKDDITTDLTADTNN